MIPKLIRMLPAVLLFSFQSGAGAHPYTIDGDLSDWLAASPVGSADDWTPWNTDRIKWHVEDQYTNYLDPGYGGQRYDAEAIYVDLQGSNLYIAVVTGRAPGFGSGYAGGDIALNVGWNGGVDDSFEIGVITQGHGEFSAGDVVRVAEWNYGLWTGPGVVGSDLTAYKKAHPVAVRSGTRLGNASLAYQVATYDGISVNDRLGPYNGQHYLIETVLDLDSLGIDFGGAPFLVHWTEWCANDWIQVDPDPQAIPAPPAAVLLLAGLLGLGLVRRRVA